MLECGGGSAAALHEVQKYPADYNGVVVGGHAAHLTRQIFGQIWLWLAAHPNGVNVLPAPKLAVLHEAVLAKCDTLDGVKDGLLEDPTRCTFDPKEIQCTSGDGPSCLTRCAGRCSATDLRGADAIPEPAKRVWSPLFRGSELDWSFFTEAAASDWHRDRCTLRDAMSSQDPIMDAHRPTSVDFDRHVAMADRVRCRARQRLERRHRRRSSGQGGKLILSGGWNNALVPAGAVARLLRARSSQTIGRSSAAIALFASTWCPA